MDVAWYTVSSAPSNLGGEGAGVDGLGDRFLTSRAAYAYDPAAHRVMALTMNVPANGGLVPVGGTAFHDARLVVDGAAAGGAGGRVLVVHQRSVNDTGRALSLVALVNGQVIGTLHITYDVGQAVTARDGTTVVTTSDVLAVARPNGTITRVAVGATDFFGSPS